MKFATFDRTYPSKVIRVEKAVKAFLLDFSSVKTCADMVHADNMRLTMEICGNKP